MKFKDIKFTPHKLALTGEFDSQAKVNVGNYEISIVNGNGAYCSEDTFEVLIFDNELDQAINAFKLFGEDFVNRYALETSGFDDVIGHVSSDQIEHIINELEKHT